MLGFFLCISLKLFNQIIYRENIHYKFLCGFNINVVKILTLILSEDFRKINYILFLSDMIQGTAIKCQKQVFLFEKLKLVLFLIYR